MRGTKTRRIDIVAEFYAWLAQLHPRPWWLVLWTALLIELGYTLASLTAR